MENQSGLPAMKDNLVRALYHGGVELRDDDSAGPVMEGHFSVFNMWAEINSQREGRFLERIAPGAFRKTFKDQGEQIKVLFQHGKDPQIGDKPLGAIETLEEDDAGASYAVRLLDASYVRELIPALKAKLFGASFRFRMMRWKDNEFPSRSEYNPEGLLERTVLEAMVYEFGPVTFPAYKGATAGVRSLTDLLGDIDAVNAASPILQDEERLAHATAFITRDVSAVEQGQARERSYDRICERVGNAVWAIHPPALETILSIISERASGYRPTEDEIRERIGVHDAPDEATPGSPVSVINISGPITPFAGTMSDTSGGSSVEGIRNELRAALADESVQSILLNIDSPGGSVDLVPELGAEILAARDEKPVVALANTFAASAAYWLASQAGEIVVTPSGEVGSIGVYSAHTDRSKKMEKEGLKTTLVKAGKYKAEKNPFEPLSDEGKADMQSKVDTYYSMFLDAVAEGRGTTTETVGSDYGQGRMVMAKDAVAKGMADRVATFDQTLAAMETQALRESSVAATIDTDTDVAGSDSAPPVDSAEPEAHPVRGRREETPATIKWWRDRDDREVPESWRSR